MVAGAIGGAGIMVLNITLLLLGVEHGTYWQAMGGLFYDKSLLHTWSAQLHGVFDAIGVSAASGVLLSLVILLTGKDYLPFKSIAMSASGAYFLFLAVYPQTALGKDSLIVPWVALIGHTMSNGLLTGYILTKICDYDHANGRQDDKTKDIDGNHNGQNESAENGDKGKRGISAPKAPVGP